MASGALTLGEIAKFLPMPEVKCDNCGRRGRYRSANLVEKGRDCPEHDDHRWPYGKLRAHARFAAVAEESTQERGLERDLCSPIQRGDDRGTEVHAHMAGKLVIFHDPEQKPFHFAEHTPGLAHPVFAAGIQKA